MLLQADLRERRDDGTSGRSGPRYCPALRRRIAFINSVGSLGGLFGPYIIWSDANFHGLFPGGLLVLDLPTYCGRQNTGTGRGKLKFRAPERWPRG